MDNWIPVKERLPDHSCRCLVTCNFDNDIFEVWNVEFLTEDCHFSNLESKYYYDGPGFYDEALGIDEIIWVGPIYYVTAWMPIPEPYKES